jgi:hypothetical protein
MDYDLDIAEDEVGEQLKQEITVLKRQRLRLPKRKAPALTVGQ